jgi:ABC-2 type transport system permease protein
MTYRLSFVQSLIMLLVGLVSMDFFAQLVDEGAPPSLASYDNDYFSFALVGIATALFAQSVVGLVPGAIRSAQVTGTLEVMLSGRTGLHTFLIGSGLYGFCYALIRFLGTLAIGSLLLGANIFLDGALVAASAFALTAATFAGVGILAAAFVVWFKQREPFTGAFMTLSLLLSGVMYPTTLLPGWLEKLANVLPLTHTVEAMRLAFLKKDVSGAADDLLLLALFALLLPVSVAVFSFALQRARAAGSLGHY